MTIRKFFASLLIVASLLTTAVANAEVQTYTGVGEYYMSDFETPNVAQQRAKQRAEQDACEQAGVYVKSFSRMKNSQLVDDEIITMTSGVLKILDVQYQRENSDKMTLIRATIKANIDSDDVLRWLNKNSDERADLVAEAEELRKANAEQERQIAALKQQLADVKTNQDEERITQAFAAEDKIFMSNQKVIDATRAWERGNFNDAIKLCTEAITLNPNNALALNRRAAVFNDLRQFDSAIHDYDRAITLDPNFAVAYNNRGVAYMSLNQFDAAIRDFNRALQINPNYASAYNNRGVAYMDGLNQFDAAIRDYDRALQLNPNFPEAYNNRGLAYAKGLKQIERSIQDFTNAIALNPNDADFYGNRGVSYAMAGNFERALADFNKAVELNPNNAVYYKMRGQCYRRLGDDSKAQSDFDKANQLG